MVEQSLSELMQSIFDLKKTTFNAPGESQEQGCLFLEVEESKPRIKDGLEGYRVQGTGTVFAPAGKMPLGYFAKCIRAFSLANPDQSKDLFFYDLEKNSRQMLDVIQRSFSFVYFFSGQHDPDIGTLTSIQFEVAE